MYSPGPSSAVFENIDTGPEIIVETHHTTQKVQPKKKSAPDESIENLKKLVKVQNNLLQEMIAITTDIAEAQKRIAEAERVKAEAIVDMALSFKTIANTLKK